MEARLSGRVSLCAASLKSAASLRRSTEVIGEPYADADGVPYLPMFRRPVLVFGGTKEALTAAHGRALARVLPRAVFTSDFFATGNDREKPRRRPGRADGGTGPGGAVGLQAAERGGQGAEGRGCIHD